MEVEMIAKSNEFLDNDFSEIQSLQNRILQDILKKQAIWIEKTVREFAVPKIRGEITVRKIKSRGLELKNYSTLTGSVFCIEQRGVVIGEQFVTGDPRADLITSPTK